MMQITNHAPQISLALLLLASCVAPRPSAIELNDEPAIVLKTVNLSDQLPFYAGFAHHAWIDLRRDGAADWVRVEVDWGLQAEKIEPEKVLEDTRWSMPVRVLASWHGEQAARMIPEILAVTVRQIVDEPSTYPNETSVTDGATGVVTRTDYNTGEVTRFDPTSDELTVVTPGDHKQLFGEAWPKGKTHTWRYEYEAWPGPNSNTFVATLLREVPGLSSELDHNSVGKDWAAGVRVGRTDAGLGFGIDSAYLGAAAGLRQGVELHLIGLTTGVSLWPPAVKIPFLPRIGIHPGWFNARWW
jgi:hypothetical protein